MKYEELIILLPCHSLEDFPQHHEGEDADGLLASWTALWHPALIASAQANPSWYRSDTPPQTLANRLIVVPSVAMRDLPTGYAQRAKSEGACLIRKESRREAIIEQALAELDGSDTATDAELVLDFFALGYCYLQVQLLTRQMRYASNLDEIHFRQMVVAAADAAMSGQSDVARDKLASCFHVLAEERDHYYSVEVYLLDLTLVAGTTIGESLRNELLGAIPTSVLIAGEVLERLATDEPESLNRLRNEIEAHRVSLVGGEWSETRAPLLSSESLLRGLRRGLDTCQQWLGARPEIYGRRRFGLTPSHPSILRHLGMRGALLFTLDEGRCPFGAQSKTRWEAADGTVLDALGKPPLDASKPETFLGLATKLGGSMDSDHVATLSFAHWPGQTSCWYDDLKRSSRYCSALGKFIALDQYFRDTIMPSHQDRFNADQSQSPYLKQSIIRREMDPISRWVRYWKQSTAEYSRQSLAAMTAVISNKADLVILDGGSGIDSAVESEMPNDRYAEIMSNAEATLHVFAATLPRRDETGQAGVLIVNPLASTRRIGIRTNKLSRALTSERPVVVADEFAGEQHFVVEVPPLGFAWAAPSGMVQKPKRPPPPLAEPGVLRNEFFEAIINSDTGTLQSIHVYNARGNRLSQQLALRLPDSPQNLPGDTWQDPDEATNYSRMVADEVVVTTANTVCGEIKTKGRLLSRKGKELARFSQTYQLWRGSRVLRVDIELEPLSELLADPWNSYIACRFAWPDEAASLWRAVNETRQPAESKRFESPLYIEIEGGDSTTSILTAGLPYHRRSGPRMLDSLLIVRGETARRFEIGIAIDCAQPMQEALGFLSPTLSLYQEAAAPAPANSGWLFHLDAKHVIATYCSPLVESQQVVGIRLRLHETAGRAAVAKLSAFRELKSARHVDQLGQTLGDCAMEGGNARIDLTANEWLELEARWS